MRTHHVLLYFEFTSRIRHRQFAHLHIVWHVCPAKLSLCHDFAGVECFVHAGLCCHGNAHFKISQLALHSGHHWPHFPAGIAHVPGECVIKFCSIISYQQTVRKTNARGQTKRYWSQTFNQLGRIVRPSHWNSSALHQHLRLCACACIPKHTKTVRLIVRKDMEPRSACTDAMIEAPHRNII